MPAVICRAKTAKGGRALRFKLLAHSKTSLNIIYSEQPHKCINQVNLDSIEHEQARTLQNTSGCKTTLTAVRVHYLRVPTTVPALTCPYLLPPQHFRQVRPAGESDPVQQSQAGHTCRLRPASPQALRPARLRLRKQGKTNVKTCFKE